MCLERKQTGSSAPSAGHQTANINDKNLKGPAIKNKHTSIFASKSDLVRSV